MEVETTFLHEILKEEVYVEQPHVFNKNDRKNHACRLKKSFYGLK